MQTSGQNLRDVNIRTTWEVQTFLRTKSVKCQYYSGKILGDANFSVEQNLANIAEEKMRGANITRDKIWEILMLFWTNLRDKNIA